jgi:hypothetical protein
MEWNITKSQRRCTQCEAAFAEGAAYTSALYEEQLSFVRRDFCPKCWDALPDRSGVFSFWRTRVPKRDEERKLFVDDSVVLDFFRRLGSGEDEKRLNFRYILALLLMRKKLLKFVDIRRREGREYLVLKQPHEEQEHEVLNPQLNEGQLEQVRQDLSQILEADL